MDPAIDRERDVKRERVGPVAGDGLVFRAETMTKMKR